MRNGTFVQIMVDSKFLLSVLLKPKLMGLELFFNDVILKIN
jgi:hypothetical protein